MSASEPSSQSIKSSEPSPWTEGDISIRKGSCNVLLIAPHGHPENDKNSAKLARKLADRLKCYAVINEKYQKPSTAGYKGSNLNGYAVDLNNWREAGKFKKTKAGFLAVVEKFKKEILEAGFPALVVHVHGINDENIILLADKIVEFKSRPNSLQAVIGYGQRKDDDSRFTASKSGLIDPLIKYLSKQAFNAAIAPVDPIIVEKNGKKIKKWYCGNHNGKLNQYFSEPKQKVQSVQIEFKKKEVREFDSDIAKTAEILSKALRPFVKPFSDSAVQKGTIQQIKVSDIDPKNNQFMARIDDIKSSATQFKDLVMSIKKNGVLNNIIVRKQQNTHSKPYQLISGFRRMAALQEVLSKKELASATLPARVLSEGLSDDEAYQISFTENLARDDLSLWEIAKACAKIKASMDDGSKSLGEIEAHLSGLIQKDTRTVRRYLKLASIQDKNLIEAIHTGIITATDALEIGKNDIIQEDPKSISALLLHLKQNPKTTREFKIFYQNLEHCCTLSALSVAEVIECKYADEFLSLDNKILKDRIKYLHELSGRPYRDVLRGKAGSLIKNSEDIEDGLKKKQINNKFQQDYATLAETVAKAFEQSEIAGKFKIKPNLNSPDSHVSVTITAPEDQIWRALEAVYDVKAKPNFPDTEKAKNKSKSRSPKQQNKSKKSDEGSPREDSKQVFKGEFEL